MMVNNVFECTLHNNFLEYQQVVTYICNIVYVLCESIKKRKKISKFIYISIRNGEIFGNPFFFVTFFKILIEVGNSTQVFSGGRTTRSIVLCVCFVDCFLSFCPVFPLAIVLSVLPPLWIMIAPLVSLNSSVNYRHPDC